MPANGGVHRPSKRLGQNFLVDLNVAEQIVSSASPGPNDAVLEPGPGHGTLTRLLMARAGRIVAVEKDPFLVRELRAEFSNQSNVTIIEGDVLKMQDTLPSFNKLVSTPPYYLSSKLIIFLAGRNFELASMVLQKEFGERLLAKPGTSGYGRLSVAAQRKLNLESLQFISRTSFHPRPKVDSMLLRFSPKKVQTELDEFLFEEMVRGIFTQRRRLLRGALRNFLTQKYGRKDGKRLAERVALPDSRVYQLSIDQLENLSIQLWRLFSEEIASGRLNRRTEVNHI